MDSMSRMVREQERLERLVPPWMRDQERLERLYPQWMREQERMARLFQPTATLLLAERLRPLFVLGEVMSRLVSNPWAALVESQSHLFRLATEENRRAINAAFMMADLVPSSSMDPDLITAVVSAHMNGATEVEMCQLVLAHYDADNAAGLQAIVDRAAACPDMQGREPVLRDTLAAHRQELDTITTYPLVAMIEGIMIPTLNRLVGEGEQAGDGKKRSKKLNHNQISEILLLDPSSSLSHLPGLEGLGCLICYLETELYHSFDWATATLEARRNHIDLNRHRLLHGHALQGTRMNTVRCFLILDFLVDLLPVLHDEDPGGWLEALEEYKKELKKPGETFEQSLSQRRKKRRDRYQARKERGRGWRKGPDMVQQEEEQ